MASIIPDLADMFGEELIAQPVTLDEFGEFVASGEQVVVPAHIEGESRLIRDASGREVVSSVQAHLAGAFDLTVDRHRYTLPERFSPRENLRAVGIERASDESGPHHEVVLFP